MKAWLMIIKMLSLSFPCFFLSASDKFLVKTRHCTECCGKNGKQSAELNPKKLPQGTHRVLSTHVGGRALLSVEKGRVREGFSQEGS